MGSLVPRVCGFLGGEVCLSGRVAQGEVAEAAEANNHHPDIFINYKRITVRYWTHTAAGVTLADVQMAQKIDPLF